VTVRYNGSSAEIGVVPDLAFPLLLPDGRRRAFFAECDRGTMPVERGTFAQTSVLRRFPPYEGPRAQSLHTRRFGWKAYRVLVITANAERSTNMRAILERTSVLKGFHLLLFAEQSPFRRKPSSVPPGMMRQA
jgi:hypothetical protein